MSNCKVAPGGHILYSRQVNKAPNTLDRMSEKELEELLSGLRAWAEAKHGRQKELAEAMGVTENTISHWLGGRKRPSLAMFFKLKAFLQKRGRRRK